MYDKNLIDHLNRIFPHLKLYYEGECFRGDTKHKNGKLTYIEKLGIETEYSPPMEYEWIDIIKILNDNGLSITYIKNK